ncbi:hypothetical protein, conserved [Eimeria tenella]|uniref:Uncharacterized protein n=1 Tax=Eimeria tenella TaxID=5802 RepID=U6L9F2_EIMTE|nr:hypothetical protein, conserved [Eimeria tenella]CDJ45189.1 hypothetical protein, conserved [Eimeria tenella]|eukprot:XP_013235936.1 hypothetical protein, conserved [Eimeria tenella]
MRPGSLPSCPIELFGISSSPDFSLRPFARSSNQNMQKLQQHPPEGAPQELPASSPQGAPVPTAAPTPNTTPPQTQPPNPSETSAAPTEPLVGAPRGPLGPREPLGSLLEPSAWEALRGPLSQPNPTSEEAPPASQPQGPLNGFQQLPFRPEQQLLLQQIQQQQQQQQLPRSEAPQAAQQQLPFYPHVPTLQSLLLQSIPRAYGQQYQQHEPLQHEATQQQQQQHQEATQQQQQQHQEATQQQQQQHQEATQQLQPQQLLQRPLDCPQRSLGQPQGPTDGTLRGPLAALSGPPMVQRHRASTEQAAATAAAVAAAAAAVPAAAAWPADWDRGVRDGEGPSAVQPGDRKRKPTGKAAASRRKVAAVDPRQQQQKQQQQLQYREQLDISLLQQQHGLQGLPVNAGVSVSARQQQQLLILHQLLLQQQRSLFQHAEQQQQQWQLLQRDLSLLQPREQQAQQPGDKSSVPLASSQPSAAAAAAAAARHTLQQLQQLHQAALQLQHKELGLSMRELETLYLPLLWSSSNNSSSSSSSNSASSSSSNAGEASLGKYSSWKRDKGTFFAAIGEGCWMAWPAERQNGSSEWLLQQQQQQLQPLLACVVGEKEQRALLQHIWCSGADALEAAAAALRGPPGAPSFVDIVMRLPPPCCYSWSVRKKGILFVWRHVASGEQQQKQLQQQQEPLLQQQQGEQLLQQQQQLAP